MPKIRLAASGLPFLREMDSRLISYNIEMTEVTGGTFWKLYTPAQIEGKEEVPQLADLSQMGSLLEMFPPADLQDQRALDLAKALGSAYIRVSGSYPGPVGPASGFRKIYRRQTADLSGQL